MKELDELIKRQNDRINKLLYLISLKRINEGEEEKRRLDIKIGCYRGFLQDLKLLKRDIEENKQNEQ